MKFFLHWGCLLIFALVAPIALPAGGVRRDEMKIVINKEVQFCFAGGSCELLTSPYSSAIALRKISSGTPIRIIRFWNSHEGDQWAQVQLKNTNFVDFSSSSPSRGWINV